MPKRITVSFRGPGDMHQVNVRATNLQNESGHILGRPTATETTDPNVYAVDPDSIVLDMRENGRTPSIGPTFQIEDV